MKVLIVARYKNHKFAPFVTEQVEALIKVGVECEFFPINRQGLLGYISEWPKYLRCIRTVKPDIVHAHYGLCGLFANLQRRVPVVTTYHGSDINNPLIRKISQISLRFSAYNIFVSQKNIDLIKPLSHFALLPCGINLDLFPVMDKAEARKQLGLLPDKKYVLFAGAFDNAVKNSPLAFDSISLLSGVELLELKGYPRKKVAILMNAVDALLLTSLQEGSPQVVKEALACGCPIVSVNVGDVRDLLESIEGCYVAHSREPEELSSLLKQALNYDQRITGREALKTKGLTNEIIAPKIYAIYNSLHS